MGSGITFDTYTPGQISVDNVTMTTPAQFSGDWLGRLLGLRCWRRLDLADAVVERRGAGWHLGQAGYQDGRLRRGSRVGDVVGSVRGDGGPIADPDHRRVQYKAELATTNTSITPCLYDVTATYATAPEPPPDPTPTTLSAASSDNPSDVGEPVTYTATVSPTPDGGTVAFFDGSAGILDCAELPVSGGHATCTVTYSEPGSHTIGATYSGNTNFGSSSASAIEQVVNETAVAPVITWSDPVAITYGTALGTAQLSASANTPGTFVYTPDAGTILDAGNHRPSGWTSPQTTRRTTRLRRRPWTSMSP